MSADVLTLTIPILGSYASVNHVGASAMKAGPKSTAFLELFRATREEARRVMAESGWQTAEFPCAVQIVRYCPRRNSGDCANFGKLELDSLSPSTPKEEERDRSLPFAGVWVNDKLARPYSADIEYDPEGQDRMVIVIRRRFPEPAARAKPIQLRPVTDRITTIAAAAGNRQAAVKGERLPLLNGEPISMSKALALIGRDK